MSTLSEKIKNALLGKTYIYSVGQAGYIIKSASGQLLGIDLYLSDCVERLEGHIGFKRLLPHILEPEELVLDCLIATHPHYDHFDYDSMSELMNNNKTMLYASVNCKKEVSELSLDERNITYVKPGDTYERGEFKIEFVSCDHGQGAPDAVGVVIKVDGKVIYEAGDTCLRLDRVSEYLEKGPFDVMIAPINGAYGNLNEEDCVKLSIAIKPKITIPCHYGMFASHGGDVGKFMDLMRKECPDNQFMLLAQGEEVIL